MDGCPIYLNLILMNLKNLQKIVWLHFIKNLKKNHKNNTNGYIHRQKWRDKARLLQCPPRILFKTNNMYYQCKTNTLRSSLVWCLSNRILQFKKVAVCHSDGSCESTPWAMFSGRVCSNQHAWLACFHQISLNHMSILCVYDSLWCNICLLFKKKTNNNLLYIQTLLTKHHV